MSRSLAVAARLKCDRLSRVVYEKATQAEGLLNIVHREVNRLL